MLGRGMIADGRMACGSPADPRGVERHHALALLRQMLLLPRFEEKAAEQYTLRRLRRVGTPTRRSGTRGRPSALTRSTWAPATAFA